MMKKIPALPALALVLAAALASAEPFATEYGVTFGMTASEVREMEEDRGNTLNGTYEGFDNYQLYYENDIHFHSLRCLRMEYDFDITDRLLYQVYYVSKGGAPDFAYARTLLVSTYGEPLDDPRDVGVYSRLYDQHGQEHEETAHWVLPEDVGLGIDLWYNQYDTVFIAFYDASNPVSYGMEQKVYTDESGIRFPYIEGWDTLPGFPGDTALKIIFASPGDATTSIQYMRLDLYTEELQQFLSSFGYTREYLDADFLTDEMIDTLMYPVTVQDLRTAYYQDVKYRIFKYEADNDGEYTEHYHNTCAITMKDGYAHLFQFSSPTRHDELLPVFEQFMNTVFLSRQ